MLALTAIVALLCAGAVVTAIGSCSASIVAD
jgi:hypothetical protein